MILTTSKEISAYLPTSKWKDPEKLFPLIEEEEDNILVPLLGRTLFDTLVEKYQELQSAHGGVTPDRIQQADINVKVIRMCQKIVLYMALANSSGILGVSFNPGGGFNQMVADNYEAADKNTMASFERDTWKKAHRNIDALLALLEDDALSAVPVFADQWRKSRYWYLHSELLFTTAMQMSDYLDIQQSREKFIQLVPDIKYCQGTYIVPQIGEELTSAFLKSCTDSKLVPDMQKDVWKNAIDLIRLALALYVENRQPKMKRPESLDEANMTIARAVNFISAHQKDFEPYVKGSPFYVKPMEAKPKENYTPLFDANDPSNMITVITPGLRRY